MKHLFSLFLLIVQTEKYFIERLLSILKVDYCIIQRQEDNVNSQFFLKDLYKWSFLLSETVELLKDYFTSPKQF